VKLTGLASRPVRLLLATFDRRWMADEATSVESDGDGQGRWEKL